MRRNTSIIRAVTKPSAKSVRRNKTRRVVMFGTSPVTMLDIVGPLEVFSIANQVSGFTPAPYHLETVAIDGAHILGTSGLLLKSAATGHRMSGKIKTEARADRLRTEGNRLGLWIWHRGDDEAHFLARASHHPRQLP